MNLTDINKILNNPNLYWGSCGYEDVQVKFDVTPHEYLEFMEEDLKGADRRSLINALSNAKRALDCQIESLLYGYCLKNYADKKKMGIPNKIELLNKLGIIAPRILRKINKVRNTMEHDFYCIPKFDREKQEIVIDVRDSAQGKHIIKVEMNNETIEQSIEFLRLYIDLIN